MTISRERKKENETRWEMVGDFRVIDFLFFSLLLSFSDSSFFVLHGDYQPVIYSSVFVYPSSDFLFYSCLSSSDCNPSDFDKSSIISLLCQFFVSHFSLSLSRVERIVCSGILFLSLVIRVFFFLVSLRCDIFTYTSYQYDHRT